MHIMSDELQYFNPVPLTNDFIFNTKCLCVFSYIINFNPDEERSLFPISRSFRLLIFSRWPLNTLLNNVLVCTFATSTFKYFIQIFEETLEEFHSR